ncbi:hypothetical protein DPMN_165373 [Dreissena polymorpha]|uniref:Uncharacterized protein n=1 Tax=Dreissena polymorpha TaxID=45954 RepID=A0A9D4EWR2_DREPO|nr:hypothetical protein DPMN_165373 [Dreissena polymorpha]
MSLRLESTLSYKEECSRCGWNSWMFPVEKKVQTIPSPICMENYRQPWNQGSRPDEGCTQTWTGCRKDGIQLAVDEKR